MRFLQIQSSVSVSANLMGKKNWKCTNDQHPIFGPHMLLKIESSLRLILPRRFSVLTQEEIQDMKKEINKGPWLKKKSSTTQFPAVMFFFKEIILMKLKLYRQIKLSMIKRNFEGPFAEEILNSEERNERSNSRLKKWKYYSEKI